MVRRRCLAAMAAVAALLVTGCAAAQPAPPVASFGTDGPLHDYLVTLSGGETSDEELAAQDTQIQDIIATCMADEGFDYTPVSQVDPFYQPDEWRPDDESWVAQWGYGVVDFPGSDQMHAAQDAGDANSAYYSGLSTAEQAAYSDVLYGPAPTDEQIAASVDGSAPISWEQQGCWGRAHHEVQGDQQLDASEFTPLRQDIQNFQQTQFAAPEYAELDGDWADCMAAAGYPDLDRPEAAETAISDALTAIFYASPADVPWSDPQIRDLHEKEVKQALADLQCRQDVDYRTRSWAIQVPQENQFIADHQTEFDALAAAISSGN